MAKKIIFSKQGLHYLIIFENNQIKSVQKNVGHYD